MEVTEVQEDIKDTLKEEMNALNSMMRCMA